MLQVGASVVIQCAKTKRRSHDRFYDGLSASGMRFCDVEDAVRRLAMPPSPISDGKNSTFELMGHRSMSKIVVVEITLL